MRARCLAVAALLVAQVLFAAPAFAKGGSPPPPPPPPPTGPPAPVGLTTSGGAQPITLSWGASSGTTPIVAYNWQVGTTSTFASLIVQGSTAASVANGPVPRTAQASGLDIGTYFWRVDAVQAASDPVVGLVTGPWSTAGTLTVTSTSGLPAAPTLVMPLNGSRYHPYEQERNEWTAVPGAAYYLLEYDNEPTFSLPLFNADYSPIHDTKDPIMFGEPDGDLWFRVRAVDANGVRSLPSNVRQTTISYTAPITPPGPLVAPPDRTQSQVPLTLDWGDDTNPQTYELQIGSDPTFAAANAAECTGLDWCVRGIAESQWTIPSISTGTKYWRVRSEHGEVSPTVPALSTWSRVGTFTVLPTPAHIVNFQVDDMTNNGLDLRSSSKPSGTVDVYSGTTPGDSVFGRAWLDNLVPGNTTVALSSDDPATVSVPQSFVVPGACCFDATETTGSFPIAVAQITGTNRVVHVTASLPTGSKTVTLIVHPPSLRSLQVGASITASGISAGVASPATLMLNGAAPAGGATVTFTSSNPALVPPPAPVTIPAGAYTASFSLATNPLPATAPATPVTVTANWGASGVSNSLTLHPPPTLISPANGATAQAGTSVTFDWADELTGDEVEVSTFADFHTVVLDQYQYAVSQYSTSALPAGTLYWRARTYDDNFQPGLWSGANTLIMRAPSGPLSAPTLSAPATGTRFNAGVPVTFSWSAVPGAASYTIQIDDSSAFTAPLTISQTVNGLSLTTSTLPRTTLSWRIRANDGAGNPGTWSAVRNVQIK